MRIKSLVWKGTYLGTLTFKDAYLHLNTYRPLFSNKLYVEREYKKPYLMFKFSKRIFNIPYLEESMN